MTISHKRVGILILSAAATLWGQSETGKPLAFDVVSVKPHAMAPGTFFFRISNGGPLKVRGNTFNPGIVTLTDLLMDAYGVKNYQIAGLPDWGKAPNGDHFDVMGKSEQTPTADQLQEMLRTLLADRFQLKLHKEMRDLPVYALVIGKNGSKLRELTEEEKTAANAPARQGTGAVAREYSAQSAPTMRSTVPILISLLANVVDRPVVDHTGLTGTYEFASLDWRQFGQDFRGTPGDSTGPSVFTALQQELGLKLDPRKEPLEVLVIDRVEKPTAN